ncbi:MAG: metallopeptidase family protein [Ignavibacteria bacterium]|nr:metallopeptidase family protein [Ignavibacteria bacterium]
MYRVSRDVFHKLVEDALELIPDLFKSKIANLVFIVEDYPSDSDLERLNLKERYSLLGLYSGVPYTHRNSWYYGVTPDRIILFQRNIEALCNNESELRMKILEVIVHEIAHYFGMNEKEIREAGF